MRTALLFIYAATMTYFGTMEIQERVERYLFAKRGYEIVEMVKLPDGIESSYMQQAKARVKEEEKDAIANVLKVHFPKVIGVN